ncbi:MAG: hypothetical protein LBU83_01375 [Bacteroidales bacterium]|jgi:hypothetical protein|nr:hypothetical protein [Bacteroidales bacterium]
MQKKTYKIKEDKPTVVEESAIAYQPKTIQTPTLDNWNPNIPFHGTQEEWWEHFHQIEEGEFMTLEEVNREFEIWKKEYLANRFN